MNYCLGDCGVSAIKHLSLQNEKLEKKGWEQEVLIRGLLQQIQQQELIRQQRIAQEKWQVLCEESSFRLFGAFVIYLWGPPLPETAPL